jgi:hypothetical protein
MNVDQLDHFFGPELERAIQLRDQARSALLHLARIQEEVRALESEQRQNLVQADRHGAHIRTTGAQLDRARLRLAQAQAEAQRLEGQLLQAARACRSLFPEKVAHA